MKRNLFVCDPGGHRKGNAIAHFVRTMQGGGLLSSAVMVDPLVYARQPLDPWCGGADEAAVFMVERPQQDGRTRDVPPEIMIDLSWSAALAAGAWLRSGAVLEAYTPTEWKGTEPKAQMHWRALEVLTAAETALLPSNVVAEVDAARRAGALKRWARHASAYYSRNSRTPDLLDSVSMGLWRLDRLPTFANGRSILCFKSQIPTTHTPPNTAVAKPARAPRRVTPPGRFRS